MKKRLYLEKKYSCNFLLILLIIFEATLWAGCTKLDESVYSEVIADNMKVTENDIPSLIAPVYTNMRAMMQGWQGNFDLQEESADQIVTPQRASAWYDGGTYQRMHFHQWSINEAQPSNLWGKCYLGINTANRIIFQIESGQIPIITGKEAVIAELATSRAYYYYLLLDNFGNIPIVTDFQNTQLPSQSSRQQVYDFVVEELNRNIPLLTETVDNTTYGRFNKWSAKALLAKVYLNAGVYTGKEEWGACLQQCNDIIDKNIYELEPIYKDIFKTENQNSKELIFVIPYDEIFGMENWLHMKALSGVMQEVFNMQERPWGGNCAVPQFIDTYNPLDQRLYDSWFQGPQFSANSGVQVENFTKDVNSITSAGSSEGYRIGKFEIKMGVKRGLSNDFPVFRFADVLMMKAECLLRTGSSEEAASIVSIVRKRNFVDHPLEAIVSASQLVSGSSYNYGYWDEGKIVEPQGGGDVQYGRFLDELGWEFAAEAHRRQDIIRFGVFMTKMWFQHRVLPDESAKILFPIPDVELNKNPNLRQNPSY